MPALVTRSVAVITAFLVCVVLAGCGEEVVPLRLPGAAAPHPAEVVRIIDGDTFVAKVDGAEETVRLLNVDTPEVAHDGQQPECLALEATSYLKQQLAPGSQVQLRYDINPRDHYGRLLAAVEHDGILVNAAIAEAGMGFAVQFAPNHRFHPAVAEAQSRAEARQVGLHDPRTACTLPAQVEQIRSQTNELSRIRATDSDGAAAAIVAAIAAVKAVDGLYETLQLADTTEHLVSRYSRQQIDTWRAVLRSARNNATDHQYRFEQKHTQLLEQERKARERAKKRRLEKKRAEQERVERERAEEQRRQEELRRQEEQRRLDEQRRSTQRNNGGNNGGGNNQNPQPKATPKQDPYPGYTGPRCYAPGGKTWKPCPNR